MTYKDLRVRACVLGLAGCGADPSSAAVGDGSLHVIAVAGQVQDAVVGARVETPLAVRVEDRSGAPQVGVVVRFALTRGDGTFTDRATRTGSDGVARTELRVLGLPGDTVRVVATVGAQRSAAFRVALLAGPAVLRVEADALQSGAVFTIRGEALHSEAMPGRVTVDGIEAQVVAASDSVLQALVPACLTRDEVWVTVRRGGGRSLPRPVAHRPAAATVTLAPFEHVTLDARGEAGCVVLPGDGAQYLMVAQFDAGSEHVRDERVTVAVTPGGAVAADAGPLRGVRAASLEQPVSARTQFERALRGREALAAGWSTTRAALRAGAVVPAVGAQRRFPVISAIDGSRFDTVTAVLRFQGARVLVWLDTTAVIGEEWMQPVGRWLDGELYDVGVGNFGSPPDVDGDGRVHMVLTPVVNRLTPANQCSLSGFVAGFFSAHDLYPQAPNAAGSDVVYGHVPDPGGQWGCPHTLYYWGRNLPLAFVHELQHLISFNEKVLLRRGREESVWLNEGLSHLAEELASLVHEQRYPPPSGRMSPTQLFPDTAGWFVLNNMINAFVYLREPYKHSLTALSGGGTLEERGAGWLFTRWLTDRFGPDMPRRLVQSPLRGATNVADRVGRPFDQLAAEFSLMGYVDSLPEVPRAAIPGPLRLQSRNLRQLFARLNVIIGVPEFPVELTELTVGQSATGVLRAGGAIYTRVTAPQGAPVSLRFTRTPSGEWQGADRPRLTLFRLP